MINRIEISLNRDSLYIKIRIFDDNCLYKSGHGWIALLTSDSYMTKLYEFRASWPTNFVTAYINKQSYNYCYKCIIRNECVRNKHKETHAEANCTTQRVIKVLKP